MSWLSLIRSLKNNLPRHLDISRLYFQKVTVKCLPTYFQRRFEMEPLKKKRKFVPEECELIIDIDPRGSCYFNVVSKVESLDDSASSQEAKFSSDGESHCKNIHRIGISESMTRSDRTCRKADCVKTESKNAACFEENSTRLVELGEADSQSIHQSCADEFSSKTNDASPSSSKEPQADSDRKDCDDDEDFKSIPRVTQYVSLDCEFVGIVGDKSALGRCSIVDFEGQVICDIYARPLEQIYTYRTQWSGITRQDMKKAIPIESALSQISDTIKDKIVVGHGIHNDFQVLGFGHPEHLIRDTQRCKYLNNMIDIKPPISLKNMADKLLGVKIQTGQHCSVEDARTAMELFKLVRVKWETSRLQNGGQDDPDDPDIRQSLSADDKAHCKDCDTEGGPSKSLDKMVSICHSVLNGKVKKKKRNKRLEPFRLLTGSKTVSDYFKEDSKVLKEGNKSGLVKSSKALLKAHYDENVKHLLSDQYWLNIDPEENVSPN